MPVGYSYTRSRAQETKYGVIGFGSVSSIEIRVFFLSTKLGIITTLFLRNFTKILPYYGVMHVGLIV